MTTNTTAHNIFLFYIIAVQKNNPDLLALLVSESSKPDPAAAPKPASTTGAIATPIRGGGKNTKKKKKHKNIEEVASMAAVKGGGKKPSKEDVPANRDIWAGFTSPLEHAVINRSPEMVETVLRVVAASAGGGVSGSAGSAQDDKRIPVEETQAFKLAQLIDDKNIMALLMGESTTPATATPSTTITATTTPAPTEEGESGEVVEGGVESETSRAPSRKRGVGSKKGGRTPPAKKKKKKQKKKAKKELQQQATPTTKEGSGVGVVLAQDPAKIELIVEELREREAARVKQQQHLPELVAAVAEDGTPMEWIIENPREGGGALRVSKRARGKPAPAPAGPAAIQHPTKKTRRKATAATTDNTPLQTGAAGVEGVVESPPIATTDTNAPTPQSPPSVPPIKKRKPAQSKEAAAPKKKKSYSSKKKQKAAATATAQEAHAAQQQQPPPQQLQQPATPISQQESLLQQQPPLLLQSPYQQPRQQQVPIPIGWKLETVEVQSDSGEVHEECHYRSPDGIRVQSIQEVHQILRGEGLERKKGPAISPKYRRKSHHHHHASPPLAPLVPPMGQHGSPPMPGESGVVPVALSMGIPVLPERQLAGEAESGGGYYPHPHHLRMGSGDDTLLPLPFPPMGVQPHPHPHLLHHHMQQQYPQYPQYPQQPLQPPQQYYSPHPQHQPQYPQHPPQQQPQLLLLNNQPDTYVQQYIQPVHSQSHQYHQPTASVTHREPMRMQEALPDDPGSIIPLPLPGVPASQDPIGMLLQPPPMPPHYLQHSQHPQQQHQPMLNPAEQPQPVSAAIPQVQQQEATEDPPPSTSPPKKRKGRATAGAKQQQPQQEQQQQHQQQEEASLPSPPRKGKTPTTSPGEKPKPKPAVKKAPAKRAKTSPTHAASAPITMETTSAQGEGGGEGEGGGGEREGEADAWDCHMCTYRNSAEVYNCAMCSTSKRRVAAPVDKKDEQEGGEEGESAGGGGGGKDKKQTTMTTTTTARRRRSSSGGKASRPQQEQEALEYPLVPSEGVTSGPYASVAPMAHHGLLQGEAQIPPQQTEHHQQKGLRDREGVTNQSLF